MTKSPRESKPWCLSPHRSSCWIDVANLTSIATMWYTRVQLEAKNSRHILIFVGGSPEFWPPQEHKVCHRRPPECAVTRSHVARGKIQITTARTEHLQWHYVPQQTLSDYFLVSIHWCLYARRRCLPFRKYWIVRAWLYDRGMELWYIIRGLRFYCPSRYLPSPSSALADLFLQLGAPLVPDNELCLATNERVFQKIYTHFIGINSFQLVNERLWWTNRVKEQFHR